MLKSILSDLRSFFHPIKVVAEKEENTLNQHPKNQISRMINSKKDQKLNKKSNQTLIKTPEYDIEKTNYVGLKNQGATCYLNAIIQTLFHIPAFREFILEIPYDITITKSQNHKTNQFKNENEIFNFHCYSNQKQKVQNEDDTNIILNLQILFSLLQTSKESVSTQNLTESFGWDNEQTLIQQDIEEFCTHLLDYIKENLKNTPFSEMIDDLFTTSARTYYRGIDKEFEETSEDHFLVLPVEVKGFSTLNESLQSLLDTQYLKDLNQYESRIYGKQDATLTTKFLKFPKVLMIHLKRFEFDTKLNKNVKINSILKFNEVLDISNLLSETDSQQEESSNEYELHAVLVHNGNVDSGHYIAYIRPNAGPQWYRFNDSSVSRVDKFDAINNNFGGPNKLFKQCIYNERSFSAYMLVYIRKKSINEIFCPIDNEMVSEKLRRILIEKKRKINKVQIKIVDEESLEKNALEGKISFCSSKENIKKIFISNSISPKDFFHSIALQLQIKKENLKVFKFKNNYLTSEIKQNDEETIIKSLQNKSSFFCSAFEKDVRYSGNLIIIFMFIYIRFLKHPLRYFKKFTVKSHLPIIETIQNEIKQELNLSMQCQFPIFVTNGPVLTKIDENKLIFDYFRSTMYVIDISELPELDDIIFENEYLKDDEIKYSTNSINYFDYIGQMPQSASDFYKAINDTNTIELKTVKEFESSIEINYTNVCNLEEFLLFIRKIIGADESQVINIFKSYNVLPIQQDKNLSQNIFQILKDAQYLFVDVSQKLENDVALLEIIYSNDSINQKYKSPLLVRKDSTVEDILEKLKNKINEFEIRKDAKLRLLQMNEVINESIIGINHVLKYEELAYNLKNPLRVEPIPSNQMNIPSNMLIPVLFLDKNTNRILNFLIEIIKDEMFVDTKKRIQYILNKNDDYMKSVKYRFILSNQKEKLKDDYIISNMGNINCQIKITKKMTPKEKELTFKY